MMQFSPTMNYTAMRPGTALPGERVIGICPRCGRLGAVAQYSDGGQNVVHAGRMMVIAGQRVIRPTDHCIWHAPAQTRADCKTWTPRDIALLRQWYGVAPTVGLAAMLGVSKRALQEQARRYGISARANRKQAGSPVYNADRLMPDIEVAA